MGGRPEWAPREPPGQVDTRLSRPVHWVTRLSRWLALPGLTSHPLTSLTSPAQEPGVRDVTRGPGEPGGGQERHEQEHQGAGGAGGQQGAGGRDKGGGGGRGAEQSLAR